MGPADGERAAGLDLTGEIGWPTRFGRLARRAVLEDAPFFFLVAVFAVGAMASSSFLSYPGTVKLYSPWASIGTLTVLYFAVATLAVFVHAIVSKRCSPVSPSTWSHVVSTVLAPGPALSFALVFVALPMLLHVFIAFKASIPVVHPFSWDLRFMEWDRLLHLGRHPYVLLQPLLGNPSLTKAIDNFYLLWIPVMWLTAVWQGWHGSRRTAVRSQFLLAFAMSWIIVGTLIATLLSSAGPVYFGAVTGLEDPYAPLLAYLQFVDMQYPLRAIQFQHALWETYVNPAAVGVQGISAMPSMHVAIAVLMAFLGFSIRPLIGWIYATFALIIFIGSIHLAWHYALDGYVAFVAAALIWWASGKVTRWWRTKVERYLCDDITTKRSSDPTLV